MENFQNQLDTNNEFLDLLAYHEWASRRIFEVISHLSEEEFSRDMKSSFPSVQLTLVHMISAEWVWLARWLGESPKGWPTDWDTSSVVSLKSIWTANNKRLQDFIQRTTDVKQIIHYQNLKGDSFSEPLFVLLKHVVNHSAYHRGQIITLVRQLGHKGISTDYVVYHREKGNS